MTVKMFQEILSRHKRVAIVGGPQTGKTTLAKTCTDRPIHHNDSGKYLSWDEQPEYWKNVTAGQSAFVIEGVQAARAIRKGLQVDAIVEMDDVYGEHTPGQASMRKGHHTIMKDVIQDNPHIPIYR